MEHPSELKDTNDQIRAFSQIIPECPHTGVGAPPLNTLPYGS